MHTSSVRYQYQHTNFAYSPDMASLTRYKYQPLPTALCTRILILQPAAQPSAPLECRLETISLDGDTRKRVIYDAISYVWGEDPRERPLHCLPNGEPVFTTRNCEAALRCLRSRRKCRSLWVDVVCIDQENTATPKYRQWDASICTLERSSSGLVTAYQA